MCGIAGYASFGAGRSPDPSIAAAMIATLHHRGPDQSGVAAFPRVVLGSARLSVIDLVDGRQPIENEDGTVVVVYNGEIYNAPELRAEMIAKGHRFRTRADTEILVHLYEEEGPALLPRLNGMFAFALYDRTKDILLLARDRFGVKPLYYDERPDGIAFASEIKALRVHPQFDRSLSPEGLATFLGLFYIPDPWTAYRRIRTLEPGHRLIVSRDGIAKERYCDFDFSRKIAIGPEEAAQQTATLVRQSIRRQLTSDVPVGVLLSGGLDSRSILAVACEANPGTASFTITFDEREFDEGGAAADWARLVGSPHRMHRFTEDEFCDDYASRQRHLDQPYGLWCNVASARLAEHVHEQGFKVVLGGDGGDELFLGYPTLQAAGIGQLYRRIPEFVRRGLIAPAVARLPAGDDPLPLSFMAKSFVAADHPDLARMFFGFKEVVRFRDWPRLLTPDALRLVGGIDPFIAFSQHLPRTVGWNTIDALSYLDCKVFLPGCSLTGIDNAYMASSVELRVPFLDNDLADFASSLPPSVRFDRWKTKPILRRALVRHLLADADKTRQREIRGYRKAGFEIPGNLWIRHPRFGGLVRDILSPARLERAGFFRPDAVQAILRDQLSKTDNNERMLQAIMSLTLFLERH